MLTPAGALPGVSPGSFQVSHRTQPYGAVLIDQRHRLTLTGGVVSEPQPLTSAPALLTADSLLCMI